MKKNILIVMSLGLVLLGGCTHQQIVRGSARNPEIELLADNTVLWRGKAVDPDDLPDLLDDADTSHQETIYIKVPNGQNRDSLRMQYYLCAKLTSNGYRRPICVQEKRTSSEVIRSQPNVVPAPSAPQYAPVRYK